MQNKSHLSTSARLLRLAMYFSEIIWINVLFYFFFGETLSPGITSFTDVTSLYGWMSMTATMCYVIGVSIRPITFYYRSSRKGHISNNVLSATLIEMGIFLLFLTALGLYSKFGGGVKPIPVIGRISAFFVTQAVILILCRSLARWFIQTMRSAGHNVHRVIMVGQGDNLFELFHEMSNPFYGYEVMGYFNDEPVDGAPKELTYLGKVSDVIPFLQHNPVGHLYCALPSVMANDIRKLIDYCEKGCVRFFSVPNVRNYLKRQMQMEFVGSVPVLMIREDPLQSLGNRIIKRTFDIIASGIFLIFFWTLIYPVVALLTKIFQPGPVFFKQKRNGIDGKEFLCYKFRSMKVNKDSDKLQATHDDDRITPFGHFLRSSSIDELPQFINVFFGDMSIVGPRPHMVKHTEEYSALIDKYMVRHWVRPGITGWAQVNGARGETRELWQMKDRIDKDIWYIENWSPLLDLRIIFMTVWNVIRGDQQAY